MRNLAIALMVLLALVVLAAMARAWRRRQRRDSIHQVNLDVPSDAALVRSYPALYVSTTRYGEPLERVAVTHLSYRARGEVIVTDQGVALRLNGSPTVFITRERLVSVERATVTIDRVVETDGLVRLSWLIDTEGEADATVIDSYIRVTNDALESLVTDLRGLKKRPTTGAIA